jgi:hypothetical protein
VDRSFETPPVALDRCGIFAQIRARRAPLVRILGLTFFNIPCLIAAEGTTSGEPDMRRAILSILMLGFMAGCAAQVEKETAKMSFACEISRCDCASNVLTLFDSQPVQWKSDGSAYCPDGYHLRRLSPAPAKPI